MRHLDRNEPVTVVLRDTEIVHGRVKKHGRQIRVAYVREYTHKWTSLNHPMVSTTRIHTSYHVRPRDVGVTWARGWYGEAADALRAAVALQ